MGEARSDTVLKDIFQKKEKKGMQRFLQIEQNKKCLKD